MGAAKALISELAALGVDVLDAADIVARAMAAGASSASPTETEEGRRKRLARDRTARWRASQNVTDASPSVTDQNVTKRHESVTERHETSQPRACVGDNNSSTEVPCDYTTPQNARPISSPPTKAELDSLEAALRAAAGSAINAAAPSLCQVSAILGLLRPKSGEPCDLEADVLPVLRAKAMQARPGRVSSWDFYRPAILEARDRRLQDAPAVVPIADYRRTRPPDDENAYREARQRALAGVGE